MAADGALHYIPFNILPIDASGRRLIDVIEVVGITSMSVIEARRNRIVLDEPSQTLAMFADPVFEVTDPRLAHIAEPAPAAPTIDSYDRLPFTGYEAEAIAALIPAEERTVAIGFDASLANLLSMDLRRYRFVHFATHGNVDARYPALSAIVLSQYDDQGVPVAGTLRLHDIYHLDLNADLVILSACETALGREIRGEGLVGLTQGFLSAGARSLIISLWPVSDRATSELMKRFYANVYEVKLSPSEALREAQRFISARGRWRDPFYWGAFVLLGDWQ